MAIFFGGFYGMLVWFFDEVDFWRGGGREGRTKRSHLGRRPSDWGR